MKDFKLQYKPQALQRVHAALRSKIFLTFFSFLELFWHYCTVKRVDEVVRHQHLVTQDQFTQVSNKVSDIPEENFTINIELFRQFSQVSN
jgi:hypothetical protein